MVSDGSGLTIYFAVDFSYRDSRGSALRRVYEHGEYFEFKRVVV